jgi:hypothetical protein
MQNCPIRLKSTFVKTVSSLHNDHFVSRGLGSLQFVILDHCELWKKLGAFVLTVSHDCITLTSCNYGRLVHGETHYTAKSVMHLDLQSESSTEFEEHFAQNKSVQQNGAVECSC